MKEQRCLEPIILFTTDKQNKLLTFNLGKAMLQHVHIYLLTLVVMVVAVMGQWFVFSFILINLKKANYLVRILQKLKVNILQEVKVEKKEKFFYTNNIGCLDFYSYKCLRDCCLCSFSHPWHWFDYLTIKGTTDENFLRWTNTYT